MKAKVYTFRDRYRVVLWWHGKEYARYRYLDDTPLLHRRYAERVAEAINADIEKTGDNFRPSDWFRKRSQELYFEKYIGKWLDTQTHLAQSYY